MGHRASKPSPFEEATPVVPPALIIPADELILGATLGRGSSGYVLEATWRGQSVVAKGYFCLDGREEFDIPLGSPEHAGIVSDVFAEAGLLSMLKHPNIVAFHGLTVDAASGAPKCLIMERGHCTLRAYLRKVHEVDTEFLAAVCRDTLQGLVYLHGLKPRGVVHRDVKDDNVLLFVVVDGALLAKLCDVDLARLTTSSRGSVSAHGGAVLYMAPEVLMGQATAKMDVFSFGIMLAEMVVNHLTTPTCPSVSTPSPDCQLSPTTGLKQYGLDGRFRMVDDAIAAVGENISLVALLKGCTCVDVSKRLHARDALALLDDKRKRQEHAAVRALRRCTTITKALELMAAFRDAPDVQEAGCLTLRNVVAHNRGLVAVVLANGGVERVFGAMDAFGVVGGLQHAACRLLLHIAADVVGKERIVHLSGLDRIFYAMDSFQSCPELQCAACATLWNLGNHCPANEVAIGESGGIERILRVCEQYSGSDHDLEVMPSALGALSVLCLCPVNKSRVIALGSTPRLFALLSTRLSTPSACGDSVSVSRQVQLWRFLESLAQFPDSQQILTDGLAYFLQPTSPVASKHERDVSAGETETFKAVDAMVSFGIPHMITSVLLDECDSDLLVTVARCCANLCFAKVGYDALSSSGAVAALLELSLSTACSVGVAAAACETIANACLHGSTGVAVLLAAHAVSVPVHAIQNHIGRAIVARFACLAIGWMATSEAGRAACNNANCTKFIEVAARSHPASVAVQRVAVSATLALQGISSR